MSGHAVLAVWTPSVSRDSMPVQHAMTEWPLFADNHIYDEKKCPYSKIDNKNNIYMQERTKWTDILRVHIGRPFFRFIPHDRKKEKVRSFCSWFQSRKKRFKLFPISSKHIPKRVSQSTLFLCDAVWRKHSFKPFPIFYGVLTINRGDALSSLLPACGSYGLR